MTESNSNLISSFRKIVGTKNAIISKWKKQTFENGWRYGKGSCFAVVKPKDFLELWEVLKVCVNFDTCIIMQANTVTGGSTPCGNDYDRPVVIINTLRIKDIHILIMQSKL